MAHEGKKLDFHQSAKPVPSPCYASQGPLESGETELLPFPSHGIGSAGGVFVWDCEVLGLVWLQRHCQNSSVSCRLRQIIAKYSGFILWQPPKRFLFLSPAEPAKEAVVPSHHLQLIHSSCLWAQEVFQAPRSG